MGKRWQDIEDQIDKARQTSRHGDDRTKPREKLSWRERDKRKDSSSHSDQGRDERQSKAPKDRYANAQAQKALKGELEALFADNKGATLRQDILKAADRGALQAAMDAWIEAKGSLPADDPEVLEKCLDARRDKTLRIVVDAIAQGIAEYPEDARKVLLLKMRNKARRSFDAKLSRSIKAVLDEHGVED